MVWHFVRHPVYLDIATVANVEFTGVEYQLSQKALGELSGCVGILYNISNFPCEFIMPTFLGGRGRNSAVCWGNAPQGGRLRVRFLVGPHSVTLGSNKPLTEIRKGGKMLPASRADNSVVQIVLYERVRVEAQHNVPLRVFMTLR
jgi:hypothetical protein